MRDRTRTLQTALPTAPTAPRASSTALPLLAAGVIAGAGLALVVARRQRAAAEGTGPDGLTEMESTELELRDELPWAYETSAMVFRPAGDIAVHVHQYGALPGLKGPLDGPPMDRVDWRHPGGARLRFHVHTLSGGSRSEVTVKVAPPEGTSAKGGPAVLDGLDGEVRSAVAALRKQMERGRRPDGTSTVV